MKQFLTTRSEKHFFIILLSLLSACSSIPLTDEAQQKVDAPSVEQGETETIGPQKVDVKAKREAAPFDALKVAAPTLLLDHKWFKVQYDRNYKLPQYVVYSLTAEHLKKSFVKRADNFRADPILLAQRIDAVSASDYKYSGYDRGHMAPSGDFTWDEQANDETFVMSNIAPQKPSLNRGAWKRLENAVRRWACGEKKVTVITGPILSPDLARLPSGVTVPQEFFKVIIDETPPRKALAFIYKQTDKGDVMRERQVALSTLTAKLKTLRKFKLALLEKSKATIDDWKTADCAPYEITNGHRVKHKKSK